MTCIHGIDASPYPSWMKCEECKKLRDELISYRRGVVLAAFTAYCESGFWGDLDVGVGKLYYSAYRKGKKND